MLFNGANPYNFYANVCLFKHRLFFLYSSTYNSARRLTCDYLPIDSLGGSPSSLLLGALCRRGGYLMAQTAWTLDGGDGADDLLATVTSEGELLVYKGTDPSSASAWSLVGRWDVGRPIGRRCFQRFGGDVVLLTESGIFPLSRLLQSGNINFASALSNKIQPTIVDAVNTVGIGTQGYDITIYPGWDAMIVNFPAGGLNPPTQYVMNTITGAWCTFSGIGASCGIVFGNQWYFGSSITSGVVRKAWDVAGTLTSDAGSDIIGTIKQAYNYFGSKTKTKQVTLFRPLLTYDIQLETRWGISPDFSAAPFRSVYLRGASTIGALWDVSAWDTTSWATDGTTYKQWRMGAHVPGYAISLWLQLVSNNSKVSWSGTDYILEEGGAM
jgi:hypothetical protein